MKDNDNELTGGELSDIPNDKYKKFFIKFEEIKTLPVQNWKPVHLLGFFISKFQETFGAPYQFKFNSPSPSKCFEVFHIKKLGSVLSSKPNTLKEYINWIFEEKVGIDGKKFRSISFLTNEDIVKEYKLKMMSKSKIDRTTLLPNQIKECFAKFPDINTYGDLAFYRQALLNSSDMDTVRQWLVALDKATDNGLDVEILRTIK